MITLPARNNQVATTFPPRHLDLPRQLNRPFHHFTATAQEVKTGVWQRHNLGQSITVIFNRLAGKG